MGNTEMWDIYFYYQGLSLPVLLSMFLKGTHKILASEIRTKRNQPDK